MTHGGIASGGKGFAMTKYIERDCGTAIIENNHSPDRTKPQTGISIGYSVKRKAI